MHHMNITCPCNIVDVCGIYYPMQEFLDQTPYLWLPMGPSSAQTKLHICGYLWALVRSNQTIKPFPNDLLVQKLLHNGMISKCRIS